MIKSDKWIKERALDGMIEPFEQEQVRSDRSSPIVSYGLSGYGYDIRCSDEFKIFTNSHSGLINPKIFNEKIFFTQKAGRPGQPIFIPPNSFALTSSVEYIRMPRDVLAICVGKSTYARCGIIVNVTPLEPELEGHITLEISNTTTLPAAIYHNEGIAQLLFLGGDQVCLTSYKDRAGKYQGQTGVTLPKV